MKTSHQKQTGKSRPLSKKDTLSSTTEPDHSDDVEKVLEHVSSPFRWELLEIPPAKPHITLPKKSIHQK